MEQNPNDQTLVQILKDKIPNLRLLYFFGSAAIGEENKESDIDLAFLSSDKIGQVERFNIQCDIANILNRDVDLVDLKQASEVMRAEVLISGRLIFCVDPNEQAEYEVLVCSRYAHLNEERAEILTDFYSSDSTDGHR